MPDWAFSDPDRVAEVVIELFAAGDREAADRLIGGSLRDESWFAIDLVDPTPTSCHDESDVLRRCEFDGGAFVVDVHRDRVTGQWVAHRVEDLSGI